MFNFKSTLMDITSSQFVQNPSNSNNPNPDHHPFVPNYYCASDHQLNDSVYYRIASHLMSDEDHEVYEKDLLLEDMDCVVSENANNHSQFDGSFTSVDPVAHPIRNIRELTREDHRFAFRTKTDLEVMDDGYKWRKYGKKMVKNSPNPRNYYKCSSGGCIVKKRVERDGEDSTYVITTYQGVHNHA